MGANAGGFSSLRSFEPLTEVSRSACFFSPSLGRRSLTRGHKGTIPRPSPKSGERDGARRCATRGEVESADYGADRAKFCVDEASAFVPPVLAGPGFRTSSPSNERAMCPACAPTRPLLDFGGPRPTRDERLRAALAQVPIGSHGVAVEPETDHVLTFRAHRGRECGRVFFVALF